jgi:Ni,Fe-hydrogenase I cytochrome b subunit
MSESESDDSTFERYLGPLFDWIFAPIGNDEQIPFWLRLSTWYGVAFFFGLTGVVVLGGGALLKWLLL